VTSYAQALEVALAYSTHWLIEEFHKAIKTGTKAEEKIWVMTSAEAGGFLWLLCKT
jgi:hypothetical protein